MTSHAVNMQACCSQLEKAVKLQSNWYLRFKLRNSRYFLSLPTFWLQTVSQINKNAVIVQIALQWWKSRKGLQFDLPLTVQFMQLITYINFLTFSKVKCMYFIFHMRTSWVYDSEIWTLDNLLIKDWILFNFSIALVLLEQLYSHLSTVDMIIRLELALCKNFIRSAIMLY